MKKKISNAFILIIIVSLFLFGCTSKVDIAETLKQETPASDLVLVEDDDLEAINESEEAQTPVTNEPKQEVQKQEAPNQTVITQQPQKQEPKPSQPSNEPSKPAEQVLETKPEESKKFQDGIYTGVADGFDGPIRVRVTVANGKITGIEVLEHSDTPRFALGAFERITNNIILNQDLDIDIVSGATYSSKGFINAVNKALNR